MKRAPSRENLLDELLSAMTNFDVHNAQALDSINTVAIAHRRLYSLSPRDPLNNGSISLVYNRTVKVNRENFACSKAEPGFFRGSRINTFSELVGKVHSPQPRPTK